MARDKKNPIDRHPDFHEAMTPDERARAHAALAETYAARAPVTGDKIATMAAAHATLALYFQHEADRETLA
jgi:hypothetical protein